MLLMCIVDGIHVLIHRNWDASFDASLSNGFSKEVVEARDIVREYPTWQEAVNSKEFKGE